MLKTPQLLEAVEHASNFDSWLVLLHQQIMQVCVALPIDFAVNEASNQHQC